MPSSTTNFLVKIDGVEFFHSLPKSVAATWVTRIKLARSNTEEAVKEMGAWKGPTEKRWWKLCKYLLMSEDAEFEAVKRLEPKSVPLSSASWRLL